ncbi:MAG: DnaJ domain-containing protein [Sandaracinaceae bacterium]|nr:DnaJ domain-containing protein [Sandaracinaceae bacterium]
MAASLPEPIAQGDLARTPFAHVLLSAWRQKLTGTLVLWDPDAGEGPKQDRVRFVEGRPAAAVLRQPSSQLDRGLLPLFARASGPYAFYADVDLVSESGHARAGEVEVLPLITASLRGSSRDDAVEHVVGQLGEQKLRVVATTDLAAYGFLPKERACVDLLRAEPTSVPGLTALSGLAPREVARIVYLLSITRAVEPWDGEVRAAPKRAAAPARPSAPSEEPREAAKPARGPAPRGVDPLPPMPSDLSPEHQARWHEVAERARKIENEDYFVMLGVPRDVSAAAVQKAYFAAVKKWHPDRVPPALAALRPAVERIFGYLTRAQETLGDETKRGPYLQSVQAGGGTPEADRQLALIIQAAMEFRKVEVHLRRSEWDEALAILEEILEYADDEPDYHATRAWVLFQKHGGDAAMRQRVIEGLERAIAIAPRHDKAHYWLGLVLKRENKTQLALSHFQLAAEANPKNLEAVREVRLASMRKSEAPESKKSGSSERAGLFGKLFGGKKD